MALSRSMGARYDGVLGTTSLDTRLDLAAMLAHTGAASAAVRVGVFPGCNPNLVTGTSADWTYAIGVADFATSRGPTDGAHIFTNAAPATATTDPAPGTSGASRWDVVYVLQPSKGENADSSSTPVFAVARGAAVVGTPAVPAIPAGALELARNLMTSAATNTASSGNSITQRWKYTALRGCPIVVRNQAERDELNTLATAANPVVVDRLDTGTLERKAGSGWMPIGPGPWISYTPTLAGFALGTGSMDLTYRLEGGLVRLRYRFTIGGSASMSQPRFSLPVTAAPLRHSFEVAGHGSIALLNTRYVSVPLLVSTTQAQINYMGALGLLTDLNLEAPATWSVGDSMVGELTYKPA